MSGLFARLIGVPTTPAQVREAVTQFTRTRDVHVMRGVVDDNLSHLTSKSGALLQAQGIFIVVATYLLVQGWPRLLALMGIVLLTVAALAIMTNLRTVFIGRNAQLADDQEAEIEILMRMAMLVSRRGVIFNIALYLTFLSVLMLGAGAVLVEIQH